MKIGHIIYRYKPLVGGAEIYLDSLFKVLEEAGYSQRVYQRDNGVKSPEIKSVPKLTMRLPKLLAFNLGLPFQYHNLRKEDILIINYPEHYLPVAWHRNTIVLSHGSSWTHSNAKRMNKIRKRIAQFAFRRAKQYVANDTFVLRELGENILPQKRMFQDVAPGKWFIPNCVDSKYFHKRAGIDELKKLNPILVPRNLTISRGIDLAIQAFSIFNKKYPETNLVIAGDVISDMPTSLQYKKDLEALISNLNLVKKVHFWGTVERNKMPDIYSSALLTIIPTRLSEGTSLSALESMACGVATISTDVEGLLDLPTVHCAATIKDLAETMEKVFNKRQEVREEQQQKVIEIYNIENWQKAWLKVIEKAKLRKV